MSEVRGVHLKGLNGIRAIAAIAVVISHTLLFSVQIGLPNNTGIDLAGYGVTMFFSLSGFLITYLLLLEKKKTGTIHIRSFYIRRMLRIWPLYYFYLLLVIIVLLLYKVEFATGSLFYYIALCANIPFITGAEIPLIGHFWSLGVEEQFYLFWPWVVKKSANLIKVLIIFIGVFILLKTGLRLLHIKTGILWPYTIIDVCRFECMAIGALGAVFFYNQHRLFFKVAFHPFAQLMAWAAIALMLFNKFHIASFVDNDIVAVLTVVLIVNVAANNKTLLRLDFPPFDFLGKLSYGMYVYHPLILFFSVKLINNYFSSITDTWKYIFLFSVVIVATIFVAWISYNFFEKRFLKVKQKFAIVPSTA